MKKKKDDYKNDYLKNKYIRKLFNALILIAVLGGLSFVGFYVISYYARYFPKGSLPKGSFSIIEAVFIAVFGVIAIKIIQKNLFKVLGGYISEDRAGFFRFLLSFIAYFTLILFIFTTLGIDISNILLGATFIGVILGIASQSLLSNLFAGFVIIFGKPFKIGDRITVVTWQYGLLMSTYQHEAVKPGYTGVIKDINILFTTIVEDSGFTMRAPNNILMQALITNYSNTRRRIVRVRFELDKKVDFESFKTELFNYLTGAGADADDINSNNNSNGGVNNLIEKDPSPLIRVADVSLTSYFVAVEVYTPQIYEDPVRDLVLSFVIKRKRIIE
ncbi:MAG: mechanosensitive ion channel family protein [Deltaproteobacteria bacterium]|nr:mechanosensitive ion channel family protein [Deltaproteobacteria bacterium]